MCVWMCFKLSRSFQAIESCLETSILNLATGRKAERLLIPFLFFFVFFFFLFFLFSSSSFGPVLVSLFLVFPSISTSLSRDTAFPVSIHPLFFFLQRLSKAMPPSSLRFGPRSFLSALTFANAPCPRLSSAFSSASAATLMRISARTDRIFLSFADIDGII